MLNLPPIQLEYRDVASSEELAPPQSSLLCSLCAYIWVPCAFIAKLITNFVLWIRDPYGPFVCSSRGHFTKPCHKKIFLEAVVAADQFLHSKAEKSQLWYKMHCEENAKRDYEQTWRMLKGTCRGNCVTLARAILESHRLLSINQLAYIENTDAFIKNALTIQLIYHYSVICNRRSMFLEPGQEDIFKEKLSELGLSQQEYQSLAPIHQYKINVLIKTSFGRVDLNAFFAMDNNTFHNTIYSGSRANLKGISVRKHILPYERSQFQCRLPEFTKLSNHPVLQQESFQGVLLLEGYGRINGHTWLLEVDHTTHTYILYDNNHGFYQWNDLNSCLAAVQRKMIRMEFIDCDVEIYPI